MIVQLIYISFTTKRQNKRGNSKNLYCDLPNELFRYATSNNNRRQNILLIPSIFGFSLYHKKSIFIFSFFCLTSSKKHVHGSIVRSTVKYRRLQDTAGQINVPNQHAHCSMDFPSTLSVGYCASFPKTP